ncbi:MAG TPA: DNA polymerase III subunit delta [Candidatus Acidoferrales bacterium]|nr:DNA polymerase III subunit delta [Candidatus Acidoferrales bacterium]
MPVSPDRLLQDLKRGRFPAALALVGADSYLRGLCRSKLIEALVPVEAREWAVARLSAREVGWDEVLQRARTMPMLSPRQAVIVEDANSIERLGEKSREAILEKLAEYLEEPAPFSVLLLEADELDSRQKFSKLLAEKALVVSLTIDANSAVPLAQQMAKELGAELNAEAAAFLAEILNGEPARMRIELEKLSTYVAPRQAITTDDVRQMVISARRSTVWQMADMLANGKRSEVFAFLDNLLREGDEPIAMIGALVWMYRKLIEASELPRHTAGAQAARFLSMRPDMAETAIRQAHRIPRQELLSGLRALAEADSKLKSANPNPRAMLEFLFARLTARSAAPAATAQATGAGPRR